MTQKELWNFEGKVTATVSILNTETGRPKTADRVESISYISCLQIVKELIDELNSYELEVVYPIRFVLSLNEGNSVILLTQKEGIFGLDKQFEKLLA